MADGIIYAGSANGKVYALDLYGNELWFSATENQSGPSHVRASPLSSTPLARRPSSRRATPTWLSRAEKKAGGEKLLVAGC